MNFDDEENPPITPAFDPNQLEGVRLCLRLICDVAMTRRDPKKRTARFIAARLIVLLKLLEVDQKSLNAWERETGISASLLSKVGKAFSSALGMQATWQRVACREVYQRRARGVHAGTWQCTPKWERRTLRGSGAKLTRLNTISAAQQ